MHNSTLKPSTKPMQRSAMKRRAPKKRAGHDKRMLEACRGQECFLNIPGVCRGETETVVPAHSNQGRHGKGMGIKADDKYTIPACRSCHEWLDVGMATKQEKDAAFDWALNRWEGVRASLLAQDKAK